MDKKTSSNSISFVVSLVVLELIITYHIINNRIVQWTFLSLLEENIVAVTFLRKLECHFVTLSPFGDVFILKTKNAPPKQYPYPAVYACEGMIHFTKAEIVCHFLSINRLTYAVIFIFIFQLDLQECVWSEISA